MIAIDTNVLVYAHRSDSPWHERADACVAMTAESSAPWAVPWPCIHEFLAVVTHPRIYDPPTPLADALDQVACWLEAPALILLGEARGYWEVLKDVLAKSKVSGPRVHDARIVALCLQHGVRTLWTADRDFGRFRGMTIVNPLVQNP